MRFEPVLAVIISAALFFIAADRVLSADASICRSAEWERKVTEISAGSVDVIAVCPGSSSFFVEVSGSQEGVELLKRLLYTSDINVTGISDWGDTASGTSIIQVRYR